MGSSRNRREGEDDRCPGPSYDDTGWDTVDLPVVWEQTPLGDFDGAVWFRKTVSVPDAWIGRDLILGLGPIDDVDVTFVNGVKVGGYERDGMWLVERTYRVKGEIITSTRVTIAVRVIDSQGGGGIYGDPRLLSL